MVLWLNLLRGIGHESVSNRQGKKKRKLKKNIVNKEKTLLENFDYKYVTALEQGIYV